MQLHKNSPEEKLVKIIDQWQSTIAPFTEKCAFEVNSGYGIADVVFYNLDKDIAQTRRLIPLPLINSYEILETFSVMNKINSQTICLTQLYKSLPYSKQVIENKILKFLIDNKIATQINDEEFHLNFNYKIALKETIAIEAKVNNWQRGFYQAFRYKQYADYSYLALQNNYINPALKNIQMFKKFNIGLISVDPHLNKIEFIFKPKKQEKTIMNKVKYYASENILCKEGYIKIS